MSRRIHINLDDETATKVQALSLQEDRSISNMHRVLLNEALSARTILDHQLSRAERLLKTTGTDGTRYKGKPLDDIIAKYEKDQELD